MYTHMQTHISNAIRNYIDTVIDDAYRSWLSSSMKCHPTRTRSNNASRSYECTH